MLQRITRRAQVVLPQAGNEGETLSWLDRLRAALPEAQRRHLLEVLEKEQALVLFVDSAAWAGRIRLSLPDLEPLAGERTLQVRLAARGRSAGQ